MRIVLALAPLLLLAACATLDEGECRQGDWFEIGKADGAAGRQADFILQHAKACNEYGIRPVRSEWERGRQEGLKLYCTPRRVYEDGKRGRIMPQVCPASMEAELRTANQRGLRVNRIEQEMQEIQNEINALNAEIASLPRDDPSRSALISERSFLRLDLLHLRAERARYP
jgi:hypothetical protein